MTINLEIAAYNDNNDINFGESIIRHQNCDLAESQALDLTRNPATNSYVLACVCGLNIEFEQLGKAESSLSQSAINQTQITLPNESYSSNFEGPIVVSEWLGNNA